MANVILEISSKLGPGGFTELKSAIDLVSGLAREVSDFARGLDEFNTVINKTNRAVVAYADSAAKGQIDTVEIGRAFNRLAISGIEPTREQLASITKAVTAYAKTTGEDATAAMKQFTEGIGTGSVDALKKFGIELKSSGDLTKDQKAAIDALTDKFADFDIELSNNTERLDALSNSWGTFIATVWGKISSGKGIVGTVLDGITSALDDATAGIVSMTSETFSLDNAMKTAELTGIGWTKTLLEIGNALGFVEDGIVAFYNQAGQKRAAEIVTDISKTKTGEIGKDDTDKTSDLLALKGKGRRAGAGTGEKVDFEILGEFDSIIDAMVAGVDEARSEINDILGAPGDMSLAGIGLEGGLDMLGEDPLIAMAEKMAKGTASAYDMKVEMLELALAMQEVRNSSIEMSSEMAAADIQSMALKGTQDALRGSLNMAFDAMISGAGSGKKAFMAMISGVLKGIAVESTIKALFEAAEAIAAFASYRYDQGAQHAIAAGLYTGVAAAAAAGAVASGRAANKERSRGDVRSGIAQGKATSTGSFVSPTASSQPQTQTVKIVMDDSAAGFDAIVEQNNAATAAGRRSFQAA